MNKEMTSQDFNQQLYSCVNSKDIRKYLEELDYQFSSLEAAWLVWQCRTISIKEKHRLWKQIIDTMPDCNITKNYRKYVDTLNNSLHSFLVNYMDLQNEYVYTFYRNDKTSIYRFSLSWGKNDYFNRYNDEVYSSIEKCFDRAMSACAEYTEEDEKPIKFKITKNIIDSEGCYIEADYLPDGSMIDINPYGSHDKDLNLYQVFFDYMCFSFPVPFRKGDILWNPWEKSYTCSPIVLEAIATKSIDGSADKQNLNKIREGYSGDYSDMNIWGVFQQEDGEIFEECTWCYMDYEFYPEEMLVDEKRVLKLIGAYLKGEISITLCIKGCQKVLNEHQGNNINLRCYTSEILNKMGLY